MGALHVLSTGPAMTFQDMGRRGYLAQGLTRGGAADTLALYEGAALLGQSSDLAAIEMVGMGGNFRADADMRIALTGASMTATIDGEPVAWNASHRLSQGSTLAIGGVRSGTYGYLHVGGGFAGTPLMGSRSVHLSAGIGRAIAQGDTLDTLPDQGTGTGNALPRDDRFGGGILRVVASMQTDQFDADTQDRFAATTFRKGTRANRMGVEMQSDGAGFFTANQLNILSEVIVPGDIQITGDGAPFVLLCECQTTGGYPRIGTVIPSDMARAAQAQTGAKLTFEFIELTTATEIEQRAAASRKRLSAEVFPMVRDPEDIRDLLAYQLVGGAISATADPFAKDKAP